MQLPSLEMLDDASENTAADPGPVGEVNLIIGANRPSEGTGSNVPNAGIASAADGVAQTRYGAPRGWWTPADGAQSGFTWSTPDGKTVVGAAPGVFAAYARGGMAATDALPLTPPERPAQALPAATITATRNPSGWMIVGIIVLVLGVVLLVRGGKGGSE